MSDGELVGSARSFVETGRGSSEVGDIDGAPSGLLGVRIVDPAGGLNGGIPYTESHISTMFLATSATGDDDVSPLTLWTSE